MLRGGNKRVIEDFADLVGEGSQGREAKEGDLSWEGREDFWQNILFKYPGTARNLAFARTESPLCFKNNNNNESDSNVAQ